MGQALAEEFSDRELLLWDKEELDVTDSHAVAEKLGKLWFDLIINAAAYTDVDGCEDHPELAMKVNAKAVKHVAAAAHRTQATLVQFGTEYIFDGQNKRGYPEDAKPAPLSVYGSSKLAGELAAAQAEKFYIVRLSRLFGKAGGGKKSFVDKILETAAGQRSVSAVDEEVSSPTYAPDLAKFVRTLVESKRPYGIYHGANTGTCTWYGFAGEIFKIAGIAVKLQSVTSSAFPRKAERPKFAELLNTKLPAQRTWQEALKEYLKQ